jgi:hypothetical protein
MQTPKVYSIAFFGTIFLLFLAFMATAQTVKPPAPQYTVLRWNIAVTTTVNDRKPTGQKFAGWDNIKFINDTSNKGLVVAKKTDGTTVAFRSKNGKPDFPVAFTSAVGRQKDFMTMSIDEIFVLMDQEMKMQHTANKANIDKINAQQINKTKVPTPNTNVNVSKAKVQQARQ